MSVVSSMDQVLAQLKAVSDQASATGKSSAPTVAQADFGQILKSAVDQVNTVQQIASQLSREFVGGSQDVELHDVMISLQKANVSFQSMIQVRNRLVTAYQEIMNIQV